MLAEQLQREPPADGEPSHVCGGKVRTSMDSASQWAQSGQPGRLGWAG